MDREIAVFRGKDGMVATLSEPGMVTVFCRRQQMWEAVREQEFNLETVGGLRQLRHVLADLVTFIGGCRIFVAQTVAGVPYYELEKAGMSIWEVTGNPNLMLDDIWDKDQALCTAESSESEVSPPALVENAPGCYTMSIKELQEKDGGMTSKQALQPLLRRGDFTKLEVLCNHVPPWLEGDLQTGGLKWVVEKLSEKHVRVIICR